MKRVGHTELDIYIFILWIKHTYFAVAHDLFFLLKEYNNHWWLQRRLFVRQWVWSFIKAILLWLCLFPLVDRLGCWHYYICEHRLCLWQVRKKTMQLLYAEP